MAVLPGSDARATWHGRQVLGRREIEYNYLIIIEFHEGVGGPEVRFQRISDAAGPPDLRPLSPPRESREMA
jgi:hypothetical protein